MKFSKLFDYVSIEFSSGTVKLTSYMLSNYVMDTNNEVPILIEDVQDILTYEKEEKKLDKIISSYVGESVLLCNDA